MGDQEVNSTRVVKLMGAQEPRRCPFATFMAFSLWVFFFVVTYLPDMRG